MIESPALVEQASTTLFHSLVDSASYELRLSADRANIEWIETRADGARIIHTREPDHAWLLRLKLWLLAPFVGVCALAYTVALFFVLRSNANPEPEAIANGTQDGGPPKPNLPPAATAKLVSMPQMQDHRPDY